ncbi:MAG: glycosyltransferase family 4 protein [Patulibacter sp.]|nr:glycosyltransferase family 4 protein [Patulibacter sp.]
MPARIDHSLRAPTGPAGAGEKPTPRAARRPADPAISATVIALHHGYRVAGGEERAAAQLADLAEARLGERVAWLRRDSTRITGGDAARGLIAGGIGARQVTEGIAACGADLVHAHNLFPTFGPAALRAARDAGAAVVVHLHNYRLVCAVATTVRDGRDCTECHRGWPVPGVRHRCRGSLPEVLAYAAALPRWQHDVVDLADVVVVPSSAARSRLAQLGLRLPADRVHVVGGVATEIATTSTASTGRFALVVTRLAPEKDLLTAIDACRRAHLPLVIAGDGPERAALEAYAGPPSVRPVAPPPVRHVPYGGPPSKPPPKQRLVSAEDPFEILGDEVVLELDTPPVMRGNTIFVGRVGDRALAALRRGARVGLTPSVAHETFGLSALESMSAALPTIGSAVGALPELLGDDRVVPPGDPAALAARITEFAGSDAAGAAAAARARDLAGPDHVATRLAAAYAAARERAAARRAYR